MRVWRHEDLTGPEVTNASYPGSSYIGAVNSDAVPKDLDRMIDAALDCVAEVLWQDAGHRAPMQVTADGVEKLHGRALRIVEADMDHRRLLHQPAARNKLICGWAWFVVEAKHFCKEQLA